MATQADLWTQVARLRTINESINAGWSHEKQVELANEILSGNGRDLAQIRTDALNRIAGNRPGTPAGGVSNATASGSASSAAGGSSPAAASNAATSASDRRGDFATRARLLFPWIPEALLGVFVDAWVEYGDTNLALSAFRADQRYEQFFPGNKRDDGTTYLTEAEYLSNIEGYDRRLRMFGQDPGDLRHRYIDLIQGGTSPDEFEADLAEVQQEVLLQAPSVRATYASYGYSADVSDRAIFASRLAGAGGASPQVFEMRFRAAQIGAEATSRGFDYVRGSAERLAAFGVSQDQARSLFAQAQAELPTYNELLSRHNDPEDDLTLEEYEDALVLRDPEHLRSLARVMAAERSLFTPGDLLARDRSGGVTGLVQR